MKSGPTAYLWVLVPIAMMTAGQALSKAGTNAIASGSGWINGFLVAGYALLVLRSIVWVLLMHRMKLVFAYPLMSLTYVLVLAIAYAVFGEAVTANNLWGSGCIIFGVTLIGLGEMRVGGRRDG